MTQSRMVYQKEATRQKILDAAELMFIEKGFADTQMKDIAAAINMSRNTLYRYYQDKFDLGFVILVNVIKGQVERSISYLSSLHQQPDSKALDTLKAVFLMMCDEESKQGARFMAEFDAYYSGDRLPDDFREALTKAIPKALPGALFDEVIAQGQASGEIRTDLLPRQISAILINAIPAFHRRMILRQNALVGIEPEEIPSLTPALVQVLIDGLRPVLTLNKEA